MQTWQTRLNERKQQFLSKTKDKIGEAKSLLRALGPQTNDVDALTKVNKHFHQLAGAGGIYEMAEFCNVAIAAEELCSSLLVKNAPLGELDQTRLQALCDDLLREIDVEEKKGASSFADLTGTVGGAKILSVEDDPEQGYFIKSVLESAGYTVLHIADASKFEAALNSFAPDLVLLDIMLGEISGHDLARFVREHKQFSRLPIVFLTTENQMNMRVESVRAGGDAHLIKPIAPQLLVATISGRLARA